MAGAGELDGEAGKLELGAGLEIELGLELELGLGLVLVLGFGLGTVPGGVVPGAGVRVTECWLRTVEPCAGLTIT